MHVDSGTKAKMVLSPSPPRLPLDPCCFERRWVFTRQIEQLIFGTGRLDRAEPPLRSDHRVALNGRSSSNLLHELENLSLESSTRLYKRAGDFDCTRGQFKFLISSYNQMKQTYEPLGGPAKQCQATLGTSTATNTPCLPLHPPMVLPLTHHCLPSQLVPIKVACTLALSRGCREVLESLGGTVPEAWLKADRIAANDEQGEVSFVCACVDALHPPWQYIFCGAFLIFACLPAPLHAAASMSVPCWASGACCLGPILSLCSSIPEGRWA